MVYKIFFCQIHCLLVLSSIGMCCDRRILLTCLDSRIG